MRRLLIAALLVLGAAFPSDARSNRVPTRGPEAGPPGGIGCYWHRQRSHCGRYCYIEVDGARYCTERLRDAHTQAPADPWLPTFPMPFK